MPRCKNLQELFLQAAARWSSRVAFRQILGNRVRELEYRHVAKFSYGWAQTLWARGLRQGGYLVVWAPNSPEWVITALSTLRLGGILVPCDATAKAPEVLAIAKQLGQPLIVAGNKQYLEVAYRFPSAQLLRISACASLNAPKSNTDERIDVERPRLCSSAGSDPAVLAFTAGARGPAKGVVLTHENLVSNILAAEKPLSIDDTDKVLNALPLSLLVGFTVGMAIPFRNGATLVSGRTSAQDELREILRQDAPSVVVGTPDVFKALLNELESEAERLPRAEQLVLALCRRIAHGGVTLAPAVSAAKLVTRFHPQLGCALTVSEQLVRLLPLLSSRLLARVQKTIGGKIKCFVSTDLPASDHLVSSVEAFGIPFVNVYGLSEASPAVAVRCPVAHKTNSVGKPIPGVEIKIDSAGDQPGEILVKAKGMIGRYWTEEASDPTVLADGWLRTGDRGYLDRDGQLHLEGPVRPAIIGAQGENVDPIELEEAMLARPAILEACVFGRKGKAADEPCAVIVPSTIARSKPDFKERIAREVNEAQAALPEHKRLADYQIWDSRLPRTGTGKLRRGEIAAAYSRNRKAKPAVAASTLVWDNEALAISKLVAEVMDPEILRALSPSGSHLLGPKLTLRGDLGLDSLARVELACRLSQHLAAEITEEIIQDTQTVEDLVVVAKGIQKPEAAGFASMSEPATYWSHRSWPVEHFGTFEWPGLEDPFVVAARRTLGVVLKTTAKIFNELETAGADRLVIDPPYIVAANHVSRLDTLALMACFPINLLRLVHPVEAADELFAQPLPAAAAAYLLNAISYERNGSLKSTLSKCEALLNDGRILIVYPEGSPSKANELRPLAPVAAHLAIATGCPIIPAFIDGTREVLAEEGTLPSPARIRISFGLPLYPPLPESAPNASRDLTRRLQLAIDSLRPAPTTARAASTT